MGVYSAGGKLLAAAYKSWVMLLKSIIVMFYKCIFDYLLKQDSWIGVLYWMAG